MVKILLKWIVDKWVMTCYIIYSSWGRGFIPLAGGVHSHIRNEDS